MLSYRCGVYSWPHRPGGGGVIGRSHRRERTRRKGVEACSARDGDAADRKGASPRSISCLKY